MAMNGHQYSTSRDYRLLWTLLQTTPVVCVVDYAYYGEPSSVLRDIAATKWHAGTATIGCRGVCYVWAENKDEFVEACEREHVEAILPQECRL